MRNAVPAQVALLLELFRGEGWGEDLRMRLSVRTAGGVDLSRGSVVPALAALVRDGLIEELRRDHRFDGGGMPRVVYGITAKGLEAAAEARRVMLAVMGSAPAGGEAKARGREAGVEEDAPAPPERIVVLDKDEEGGSRR